MPRYRLYDRFFRPVGRFVAGAGLWTGTTAVLAAPVLALGDALSVWGVVAWLAAAAALSLLSTLLAMDPYVVRSWKVRDGSRVLGPTQRGGYRNG